MPDCGKTRFELAGFAAAPASARGATSEQRASECPSGEGSERDLLVQARRKRWLGCASSTFAERAGRLVGLTSLGFYSCIPGEPRPVEASVLVLESTCEDHLVSYSHCLENIAWDARFGSCFQKSVQDVKSALYSLKLGECCLNKTSVLCLHLTSRYDRKGNFYCSCSACAPIPLGHYEPETHLILNTDFHHESILPL